MSRALNTIGQGAVFSLGELAGIEPVAEGLPEWLLLMPFGVWLGRPGVERMEFSSEHARQVVANFDREPKDLLVDYDHASVYAKRGEEVPAAAWIDVLEVRPDGVWGHVKHYTPRARWRLLDREYRYLSPTILNDRTDWQSGESTGTAIHSVALTNKPFLRELPAVVNDEGTDMPLLLALCALMELPDDTTEEQALEAAKDRLAPPANISLEADTRLTGLFGLDDGVPFDDVVALAATREAERVACAEVLGIEPADLSLATIAEARSRLAQGSAQQTAEQLVAAALSEGKITPAQKPSMLVLAEASPRAFAELMGKTAPVIPLDSPFDKRKGNPPKVAVLSEADRKVAEQLGMTAEEFLAGRQDPPPAA